jgi:hypothetical protein
MDSKSQQNQEPFEQYIPRIAAMTLKDGGAAFKLDSCQFLEPMDIWAFPKYPSRTAILPRSINLMEAFRCFISTNEQFLREPDCWLGTWIHPQTGDFYLDIATGCRDFAEASIQALEASQHDGRKIVAIYNSKRRQTIYL